jgi:oligopeptidase B
VRDLHTRRYLDDFEGVAGIGSVEWCSAPGLPPAMIYTGAKHLRTTFDWCLIFKLVAFFLQEPEFILSHFHSPLLCILHRAVIDSNFRSHRVYRHVLGTAHARDELLLDEADPAVFCDVTRTKDGRYALLTLNSKSESETWTLDTAASRIARPALVHAREPGLEYYVEHVAGRLVMVTNADGATNYKVVSAPVATPSRAHWVDLIAPMSDARISEIDVMRGRLIVWATDDSGAPRVRHVTLGGGGIDSSSSTAKTETKAHSIATHASDLAGSGGLVAVESIDIALPPGTQTVRGGLNDFDNGALRMICSSLLWTDAVYDWDFATRRLIRRRGDDDHAGSASHGAPPPGLIADGAFVCTRVSVPSHDGELVPMTLLHHRDLSVDTHIRGHRSHNTNHDQSSNAHGSSNKTAAHRAPVHVVAYGAYGQSLDLSFDASRFALLRRGWVFAFAHVRGGGERGHRWQESGRALQRPNVQADFDACLRWFAGDSDSDSASTESATSGDNRGQIRSSRVSVEAHSAGGLLIGARGIPTLFSS